LTEIFRSFEEAAATCNLGYADPELAKSILERSLAIGGDLPDLDYENGVLVYFAIAFIAARSACRPIRILDIGGGFGLHARICQAKFPQWLQRWAIVESPAFVRLGEAVATETLRMFSDMDDAASWLGGVDLLYSSGTIQYFRDPISVVKSAVATEAPVQFWQRLAIATKQRAVVVQTSRLSDNTLGPLPRDFINREIRYPRTYLTETEFLDGFVPLYKTVVRVPGMRSTPDDLATLGSAFLFELEET
jgi:putative methyltransferase (TIGR04325 family)